MTLTLIRHGRTFWNDQGICQGHLDSDLTEKGIWQAERAGQRLKNEVFTHLFCSDSGRAVKTLNIILNKNEAMKSAPPSVVYDTRLRERHRGEYQGRARSEYHTARAGHETDRFWSPSGGGESANQLQRRGAEFFVDLCDKIRKTSRSANILIVSHSGCIRELYRTFHQTYACKFQKVDFERTVPNCCIGRFSAVFNDKDKDRAEPVMECLSFNDDKHLKAVEDIQ